MTISQGFLKPQINREPKGGGGWSPIFVLSVGLIVGASVMTGAFAGQAVVQRMSIGVFQHVLDGLLLCSGVALFWDAIH